MIANLLSIDVEDYFHFIGSKYSYPVSAWDRLESHVCRMTEHILEVLGPYRATFFCLGWVARKFPSLIRSIADAGHEIGSHGMYHEPIYMLGKKIFAAEASESRKLLEDCSGQAVRAFRAPAFSVRKQDTWFFSVLYKAGYTIDSSVFPAVRTIGGIPGAPLAPYRIRLPIGEIHEIPVSTTTMFGIRTAFCGGGFFRFFPYRCIKKNIQRLNMRGYPAVAYLHPRDIDILQPRLKLEPVNAFLYHYGLASAEKKLQTLLQDFCWMSFRDALHLSAEDRIRFTADFVNGDHKELLYDEKT